jgi:hypothetical protein
MFEKYRQRKRERAYQAALATWQADAAELDSIIELASTGGWSAGDAAEASGVLCLASERGSDSGGASWLACSGSRWALEALLRRGGDAGGALLLELPLRDARARSLSACRRRFLDDAP